MDTPPSSPRTKRRRKLPARRAFLYLSILALTGLVAAEGLVRAFWMTQGLPFWDCQRQIQHVYYPNIPLFDAFMRPRDLKDDRVEVLLLGASTLYPNVGPISTMLMEQLTLRLHRRVEVVDLALPAHTSLDSYYKYLELSGKSFDLVLVYDSINDLRANNCPPEVFRADYSHYQWYREVNAVERGRESRVFALPITLRVWAIRLRQKLGLAATIPEDAPSGAWSQYGSDIKSAKAFVDNLGRIVDLGHARGEKVLLMTFAAYLAPGYTREKFDARQLDYIVHWFPVEIWGPPANIMKGLAVQNDAIRQLAAARRDDVLFVDQAEKIPGSGRYFNDICHLSTDGCAQFVDNVIPVIVPYLQKKLGIAPTEGAAAIPSVGGSLAPIFADAKTTATGSFSK